MIGLLLDLTGPVVLLVVFAVLFVETGAAVGVFVPASATLVSAGVVVGLGVLPWWATVATAAVASWSGSHLALVRGRSGGPALAALARRLGAARRHRIAAELDRRAVPVLAVCQLVGGLRTVAPRLASVAGVSRSRHALAVAPAALTWAGLLVAVGATAGDRLPDFARAIGLAGIGVVCLVAVLIVLQVRAGHDESAQS